MLPWFGRLPLTVRLPLVVATMIFAIVTGVTQLAVHGFSRQFERQVERLGEVYLDGLSAAVLPYFRRGDDEGMRRVLRQALSVHLGVVDKRLLLFDLDMTLLARVDRDDVEVSDALPELEREQARGLVFDEPDASIWVWRPLTDEQARPQGRVVANLDVSDFMREREALRWQLLAFGTAISILGAALGFLVARRIQRPIDLLTSHLQASAGLGTHPIPADRTHRNDPEVERLFAAFNQMIKVVAEREGLLARMAEQDREAVLGRLAATLAHEIRNPLGGLSASVQTLRKYGEQSDVRKEALDVIERGVQALADVVDATLKAHRPERNGRALRPHDVHDMGTLMQAEARRRRVALDIRADLPERVEVSATELRQVMLNLLLNAVHASPPGGTVSLHAAVHGQMLRIVIADQGAGMDPALAQSLSSGRTPPDNPGLGVSVIVRMMQILRGRIAVDAREGGGTRITLTIAQDTEAHLS